MIIRIHNTGDPYKLPTLSVHTTTSFPFFLFLALACSFSLSLLAHSFFFLPSLFFPFLPSLLSSLPDVSWQPPPGSPVSLASFIPSLSIKRMKTGRVSLSFSFLPRWTSPLRYLPYGQMLPYNGSFFTLDTWSHSSNPLFSALFSPSLFSPSVHVVLSVYRLSGIVWSTLEARKSEQQNKRERLFAGSEEKGDTGGRREGKSCIGK